LSGRVRDRQCLTKVFELAAQRLPLAGYADLNVDGDRPRTIAQVGHRERVRDGAVGGALQDLRVVNLQPVGRTAVDTRDREVHLVARACAALRDVQAWARVRQGDVRQERDPNQENYCSRA
jgi:hypothetical protein